MPDPRALEDALLARLRARVADKDAGPRDAGRLAPTPAAPPPATLAQLHATEAACGIAFPRLLSGLYLEVANGGFGPGHGLLGVSGGHPDELGLTVSRWRNRDPSTLVAICHWGCGIYSLVDAADADARIWAYDPNAAPTDAVALFPEPHDLAAWLDRWLDGRARQPWLVEDPVDGHWRGATDEEFDAALRLDGSKPVER